MEEVEQLEEARKERKRAQELKEAFLILKNTDGWTLYTDLVTAQLERTTHQVMYFSKAQLTEMGLERESLREQAVGLKLAISLVETQLEFANETLKRMESDDA